MKEMNTMNEGDTLRYRRDGSIADNFADAVMSYHQPELSKIDGDHVDMIFSDGEICMQKCGDLLWQRNLHMTDMGYEAIGQAYVQIPNDKWPDTMNGYGYIFCTEDQAKLIRHHMGEV